MNKIKKYIFIFVFLVSLFLFTNSISADYKATVINKENSSCSFYSGKLTPTGNCFFRDSNLNSVVNGVFWLDTGDEVTVIDVFLGII